MKVVLIWILMLIRTRGTTRHDTDDDGLDKHQRVVEPGREKRFLQNYLQQQRTDEQELAQEQEHHRRKQDHNFCSIFIYTDPFLWKQVLQSEGGNATSTYYRIKRLIKRSIHHANRVYSIAEFYGRGRKIYKGIKFKLTNYHIDMGEDCEPTPKQTANNFHELDCEETSHLPMSDLCTIPPKCKSNNHNIFCNDIRSMRFYIHAFSARNHSNYCLAYAITYRDMQDFQGIAWIKGHNPNDTNTVKYYGYCAENDIYCGEYQPKAKEETSQDISKQSYNSTNEKKDSFTSKERSERSAPFHSNYYRNTGVINLHLISSGILSESTSINVFAHELGHSLGGKHDDQVSECNPIGTDNYLMTGNSKKIILGQNMNQLSVCSNREIGFNFDLVRCWKARNGLDLQHQERQSHRAQQDQQEQGEDCLKDILTCATDINSSLLKTVLFVLIIVGAIMLLIFSMAIIRYFWLRQVSQMHETEWTPNAAPYCRLCRRNIVVSDVTAKSLSSVPDDKTSVQVPNHVYVNSQADSSTITTAPQSEEENGASLSTNFHKHFHLFKTVSNQEGTFKDSSIVMAENGNGTVVKCGHRPSDSTLTI